MHNRESGKIYRYRRRVARDHIQVRLRPIKSQDAPNHPHKMVLQIGQLGRTLRTNAIHDDERVEKLRVRCQIINSAENGISGTVKRAARPRSEQGVRDCAIFVINNSDGSTGCARQDVGGHAKHAVDKSDICPTDIFSEMSNQSC